MIYILCYNYVVCLSCYYDSYWGSEKSRTWPADILIPNWSLGKPVALDLTVTSLLNAEIIIL